MLRNSLDAQAGILDGRNERRVGSTNCVTVKVLQLLLRQTELHAELYL